MSEENSNTLDLMTVKRAVYSWSIRFKSAGYGNEQLAMISKEYFEDLGSEGVTLRQFDAAAKTVRKRCRFFPSMADLLDAVREYRQRPPAAVQPTNALLADETSRHDLTPEEVARNQARVQLIAKALAGGMSFEQAELEVAAIGHIGEFNGMVGPGAEA